MYKGQIKDFPKEVVEKMLEYQVAQGNPKDVSVFEENKVDYLKGFDWDYTKEGGTFWDNVIVNHDFELFFEKYPKNETKLYGRNIHDQWFEVGQTVYSHLFPEGEGVVIKIENVLTSSFPLAIQVKESTISMFFTTDGRQAINGGIVVSQTPLEPIKNKVLEKCPFEKGEWVAVRDREDQDWAIKQFNAIYNNENFKYQTLSGARWKYCKKLSEFNI